MKNTNMNTGAASLSDERERAAITACALMIKGICLTRPNAEWTGAIEDRIQFMLKQMQAGAAIAAGGAQEPAQSWIDGVAAELWAIADVSGFDDFKLAVGGFLIATALPRVATTVMPDDTSAFKNFHRQLCERFGYVHDEKDWRRDQVSLIEWIAKRLAPAAPSVEQDECGAFAKWFRDEVDKRNLGPGDETAALSGWQARSASTSANVAQGAAIPDGWMLVPKKRGTKPLSELIIAASLACIENRLLDHDDRRELAEYADQLQNTRSNQPDARLCDRIICAHLGKCSNDDAAQWLKCKARENSANVACKPAAFDQADMTMLIKRMQDYCDSLAPPIARGLMAEAVRALRALTAAQSASGDKA